MHDVDFECYPEEHCKKAPELLKEIDASDELIHAVCSHGYGICSDVEPTHEMEKILFATDELTGLIWAAAKMRPSNSTKDMEVSSLKKKFKDKKFAAGCSREVIKEGAEKLGWELNDLFEQTILAMRESEDLVNKEMEEIQNQKVSLQRDTFSFFNYILSPFNIDLIVLYKYGLNSSIGIGSLYKIELKQVELASSIIINKTTSGFLILILFSSIPFINKERRPSLLSSNVL